MNKALYLGLVYLLPVFSYFIPVDHFQLIWLYYYVPFGALYAVYIWFKPTENITKYIFLTPPAFLVFLTLVLLIPYIFSSGINAALEFLPVLLIFAIPFGFVIGAIYVTLALILLKGFQKFGISLYSN